MALSPEMTERMDDFDCRPLRESSIKTPTWLQEIKDRQAAERAGQSTKDSMPAESATLDAVEEEVRTDSPSGSA